MNNLLNPAVAHPDDIGNRSIAQAGSVRFADDLVPLLAGGFIAADDTDEAALMVGHERKCTEYLTAVGRAYTFLYMDATTYIGKCKTKGCKCAVRATGFTYVETGPAATDPTIGYCVGNYGVHARCTEHGLYKLNPVKGRFVPEHKCDARCTNATGPSCDCSCGGANHGAKHGVAA